MKFTLEDFVKRAKGVHGDLYNYNKSIYTNTTTKIEIYDPEKDEYFWQRPTNHLLGQGNPSRKQERLKQTFLKNYGTENSFQNEEVKAKIKKTNLEKYGVENPAQNKEIREKAKQTNLKRFGVENASANKEIQEKIKKTNLERYGVEFVSQIPEAKEKAKRTKLERYGIRIRKIHKYIKKIRVKKTAEQYKEIQEKCKQTNLQRFGVEHPVFNKEIQEKTKKTNLERYGVKYSVASKEVRKKIEDTCIEKYGVENFFDSKEFREKTRQTNLEKYGVEFAVHKHLETTNAKILSNVDLLTEFMKDRTAIEASKILGVTSQTIHRLTKDNNIPYNKYSVQWEIDMFNKFSEYTKVIRNDRKIIKPLELDLYLPKLNTAIELNGDYWHRSDVLLNRVNEVKNYHYNKYKLCKEQGVRLIQIPEYLYSDDYIQEIIDDVIHNKSSVINTEYYMDDLYFSKEKYIDKSFYQYARYMKPKKINGIYNAGHDLWHKITFKKFEL